MKPIALSSERLSLEPFNEDFLSQNYVSWLNDPEVVRYSEQRHHPHTIGTCRAYMKSFIGSANLFYAIVLNEKNRHIGNINAYIDLSNKSADMGIMIGEKDCWGKGYAKEAWLLLISHLFENLHLRKITAGTMSINKPMLSLMKKSGMKPDGKRKKYFLFEGKEVDLVHVTLYRDQWIKDS